MKDIWLGLSKSKDTRHFDDTYEIVKEILKLAKKTGLDEVIVEDVVEIVQEIAYSLCNDELKRKNEQKELPMTFVKIILAYITKIMDQFVENHSNF